MIFKWSVLDVEGKAIFFTEQNGDHWIEHRIPSNNIFAAVAAKFPKLDKSQQRKLFIALKTRVAADKIIFKLVTIVTMSEANNFLEVNETHNFMLSVNLDISNLRAYIAKDIEI